MPYWMDTQPQTDMSGMTRPEQILTEEEGNALAKRVMQFKDQRTMRCERMIDELSEVSETTGASRTVASSVYPPNPLMQGRAYYENQRRRARGD